MARAIERLVPEANQVPVLAWERHPRLLNWYELPDGKVSDFGKRGIPLIASTTRFVPLQAARELKARDTRAPIERAAGFQVLRGVPKSAVIHRVHCHGAVIAPTA